MLVVGTEGTYRPFSYHEDGSGDLVGYDVEVVEAVAERLDLEVEFQETQWDAIFAGLEAGLDALDTVPGQDRQSIGRVMLAKVLPPLVAVLLVLAVWQAVYWAEFQPDYLMPSPADVWGELRRREGISGIVEKASRPRPKALMAIAQTTKLP